MNTPETACLRFSQKIVLFPVSGFPNIRTDRDCAESLDPWNFDPAKFHQFIWKFCECTWGNTVENRWARFEIGKPASFNQYLQVVWVHLGILASLSVTQWWQMPWLGAGVTASVPPPEWNVLPGIWPQQKTYKSPWVFVLCSLTKCGCLTNHAVCCRGGGSVWPDYFTCAGYSIQLFPLPTNWRDCNRPADTSTWFFVAITLDVPPLRTQHCSYIVC